MIANLPWYDLPELRDHTDAFWRAIADDLVENGHRDVPRELDRLSDYDEQWRSPQLFFSQACGYNVALSSRQYLHVLATPRYSAPGCDGSCYRSFVVVRSESHYSELADTRGARFVANSACSHSGMNSIRSLVAPMHRGGRFFGSISFSGSHVRSVDMVQSGEADIAAIDCVTYALLAKCRPAALQNLRILCQTEAAPAPPFVTSRLVPDSMHYAIRDSLRRVVDNPFCNELLLDGIDELADSEYRAIARMEQQALRLGYCEMPFFAK